MHPVIISLHKPGSTAGDGDIFEQRNIKVAHASVRHDNTGWSSVLADPWRTTTRGASSAAAVWTMMGVVGSGLAGVRVGCGGCTHAVYTSAALSRRYVPHFFSFCAGE